MGVDIDLVELEKVDVICEDMRAAYFLGDFLHSEGASSVARIVIDLAQWCRMHMPSKWILSPPLD